MMTQECHMCRGDVVSSEGAHIRVILPFPSPAELAARFCSKQCSDGYIKILKPNVRRLKEELAGDDNQ